MKFTINSESVAAGVSEEFPSRRLKDKEGEEVFRFDSRHDEPCEARTPFEASDKMEELRARILTGSAGQRLLLETVRIVRFPVYEVTYALTKDRQHKLWLVGNNLTVIASGMPKRWSVIAPLIVLLIVIVALAIWTIVRF